MAHTHKTTEKYHTANGSTTSFDFPFEYYKKADVHVTIDTVAKIEGTHYDINTGGTAVVFKTSPTDYTPANNEVVRIYRDTDVNTSKATFAPGSSIRATDLNNNETQLLFSAQEKEQKIIEADIKDGAITSAKIKDGTIATGDLANGAVTAAKIGTNAIDATNLAANSVGASELANDAVDTAAIADNAVTSAKIANGTILADDLANNSVTTDKIYNEAVTAAKIGPSAVTSAKIDNNAIVTDKIATDAVTTAKILDANVTTNKIANDSVTSYKISNNAVTTAKIPDNAVTTAKIADAELSTLAGMPSATASILADSTALTSTTTELNLLDGKSVVTAVSGSSTDVQLPTAKAVNDQILSITNALGGFVAIANETVFPNANPDPSDGAGTVVSIGDAGGLAINGSGVATVSNGNVANNATITINGFPSTLNDTTLSAGQGLQVQTTSTLHTYDYHKLIPNEAGVGNIQTAIDDFNNRYQVASSAPSNQADGTALEEGDLWYDQGNDEMKVYDNTLTAFKAISSTGNYSILDLRNAANNGSAVYDGSIKDYTLVTKGSTTAINPNHAAQLIVSVNGVIQEPNTGTSTPTNGFALNGSTIKFSNNLPSGTSVFIAKIGATVDIGTPSTNTVTSAILQNGSVIKSKIGVDAIDGTKIEDDAVAAEHIADDSVDEARLQVSNSPTNGHFLSAQNGASGGLTWASADDPTKMPLAGGTFTGDVTFDNQSNAGQDIRWDESTSSFELDDGVALWFGDDRDFSISHSNSTNYITVQQGSISISAGAGIDINTGASDIKTESPVVLEAYTSGTGGRLSLRCGIGSGTGYDREVQLEGPATMAATYRMILPQAAPTSNGQTLTATTAGVCSWADQSSGTITALNNQTADRLTTIGATTTELDGEASLTFNDAATTGLISGRQITGRGFECPATVSDDWTIAAGNNAFFPGPMTVAANKTVTVPANRTLTIV